MTVVVYDLHVESERTLRQGLQEKGDQRAVLFSSSRETHSPDSSHSNDTEHLLLDIVLSRGRRSFLELAGVQPQLGLPELAERGDDEEHGDGGGSIVYCSRRVGQLNGCM